MSVGFVSDSHIHIAYSYKVLLSCANIIQIILHLYKHSSKLRTFFTALALLSVGLVFTINKRGQKFLFLNLGDLNSLSLEVSFLLDIFARVFLFTVSLIRLSVFTFRFRYISPQKFFGRFHLLLITFVLSIILLILSSNLIFILVG